MKIDSLRSVGFLLLLSPAAIWFYQEPTAGVLHAAGESQKPRAVNMYNRLPMAFEANRGQADARVKFLSRGSGYTVFLSPGESVIAFGKQATESPAELHMRFPGANHAAQVTGLDELPGKSNYFIGNDPAKWRHNVPNYAQVRYGEIYPGIDLVYHGSWGELEYDFVVAPGSTPLAIRLAFAGVEGLRVDSQGNLVLETRGTEVLFRKPVIYQEGKGGKQFVDGGYVLRQQDRGFAIEAGFKIDHYDRTRTLVIDPVLAYSTYLGGTGYTQGNAIAVDAAGDAFVTGLTASTNFPTAKQFQSSNGGGNDGFIAKFDRTGSTLLYSTYFGGSDNDEGNAIAVDSAGNVYVTGDTASTDFPTAHPIQAANGSSFGGKDAFIAKFGPSGSTLLYSTYLGGGNNDFGEGVAVDCSGNAYLTGYTASRDFPTAHPLQAANAGGFNVFIAKLDPTGSSLRYSTYLGGDSMDRGFGIAVDSAGNAYVTGDTYSNNFPTASPVQPATGGAGDAFVASLDSTGSILRYSTYLGGSGPDQGKAIAVDSAGGVYVTGTAGSTDFPTVHPLQATHRGGGGDVFVARLNPTGSALLYSTYLGGSTDDFGEGLAIDNEDNAYVTGITLSSDFPTANPSQSSNAGGYDVFVATIDRTGSKLYYSTYLGGSSAEYGEGIAVDRFGNAYVTGVTYSMNFPTTNPLQPVNHGAGTAFVTKLAVGPPIRNRSENHATTYCGEVSNE